MKNREQKQRIEWLDFARCIAISMVLLCHAIETTEGNSKLGETMWMNTSGGYHLFRTIGFTLGRLGVPLFLFLTGYLVLAKPIDTVDKIRDFYKRKVVPLFLATEIWTVFYYVFVTWYFHRTWSFMTLAKQLLWLQKSDLSHMWYMYMIVGVYLAMPFLSYIAAHFPGRAMAVLAVLILGMDFVLPTCNVILGVIRPGTSVLVSCLYPDFYGGIYGFYLFLGYYLYRGDVFHSVKTWILAVFCGIFFACNVLLQYMSFMAGTNYNLWYSCLFLLGCAVCLFELMRRMDFSKWNLKLKQALGFVSRISLGMYFIHKPVQFMLLKNTAVVAPNWMSITISVFLVSIVLSVAGSWILSRSRVLAKYLMFM